jgi:hypothetical protein
MPRRLPRAQRSLHTQKITVVTPINFIASMELPYHKTASRTCRVHVGRTARVKYRVKWTSQLP